MGRPFNDLLFKMLIALALVAFSLPSFAADAKTQSIKVVVGSDCSCGSHSGEFDTVYGGKKISVVFYFNPDPANPAKHPLRVFKGKNETRDWDSFLCPTPGESTVRLTGKQITIEGRFKDKATLEAYKIYMKP